MHDAIIREVPILSTAWCLCWLNQIKPFQLKTFGQNINSTAPLSLLNWKWFAHFSGFTSQSCGLLCGFNISPCLALGSLSALLHIPHFPLESAKPGAGLETTMRAANICVFSVSWAAPGHLGSPVATLPGLLELLEAGLTSWFVRYTITHKLMMQLHRGETSQGSSTADGNQAQELHLTFVAEAHLWLNHPVSFQLVCNQVSSMQMRKI